MRGLSRGVRPVRRDRGSLLAAAQKEHQQNFNVHDGAMGVDFRDDAGLVTDFPEATIEGTIPSQVESTLKLLVGVWQAY